MRKEQLRKRYAAALGALVGRKLVAIDGLADDQTASTERRLQRKLRPALPTYYEIAGQLPIDTAHNQSYAPKNLAVRDGKLVFMEGNQAVVFWGIHLYDLQKTDPEVFQAVNAKRLTWQSEGLCFSDWVINMWGWQAGLDPGL
jgi:hypothetical protein